MSTSLKEKAVSGIFWSSIERISFQSVQFIIGIIMARLLSPSDFGIIGMLTVFLAISQTFIDSGFSNALIQKKKRTEEDLSTVFYFNVLISVVLYMLIYFSAPLFSVFYNMTELILVLRVISFNLIFIALCAVHRTILTIRIDFKTQSKASLTAVLISGIIGILAAYRGFGVWSLVIQSVLNAFLNMFFLYYLVKWKPLKVFSIDSFKSLFSFGSKLFASNLIHTIYTNLYTLVIGSYFSTSKLGFYSRADQLAQFPSSNLSGILQRVTFPILCSIQDDNDQLRAVYRKYLRLTAYIMFPLMMGLAALSTPLIRLLLTDKWLEASLLLKMLCFSLMWDPVSIVNLNLLYVKGRSDLVLRLEVFKKTIAIAILFASIPFGLLGMCFGRVVYAFIAVFINSHYTEKLIKISYYDQMKDLLPSLMLSLVMGFLVYGITILLSNLWLQMIIGTVVGFIFYIMLSKFLRFSSFQEIFHLIRSQGKG